MIAPDTNKLNISGKHPIYCYNQVALRFLVLREAHLIKLGTMTGWWHIWTNNNTRRTPQRPPQWSVSRCLASRGIPYRICHLWQREEKEVQWEVSLAGRRQCESHELKKDSNYWGLIETMMGIGDWEEEIKVEKNFKKEMEISKLNKNQQKTN